MLAYIRCFDSDHPYKPFFGKWETPRAWPATIGKRVIEFEASGNGEMRFEASGNEEMRFEAPGNGDMKGPLTHRRGWSLVK